MKAEKLYIPQKLKVGYNHRDDTYTKKLAYVIYYDHKDVLRKETSWKSWCNAKIPSNDFDNTPTEGFVLNKGVGGARYSDGWNPRNEYIRVYDPRNFEFEISVANLLFILANGDCSRGKGLEGQFVYAWDKNNLVLLPCSSKEYQDSQKYTDCQKVNVLSKDLGVGLTYRTKDLEDIVYIGRYDIYGAVNIRNMERSMRLKNKERIDRWERKYIEDLDARSKKVYVFFNHKKDRFVYYQTPRGISQLVSDSISPDYAKYVYDFNGLFGASKPTGIVLKSDAKGFPKVENVKNISSITNNFTVNNFSVGNQPTVNPNVYWNYWNGNENIAYKYVVHDEFGTKVGYVSSIIAVKDDTIFYVDYLLDGNFACTYVHDFDVFQKFDIKKLRKRQSELHDLRYYKYRHRQIVDDEDDIEIPADKIWTEELQKEDENLGSLVENFSRIYSTECYRRNINRSAWTSYRYYGRGEEKFFLAHKYIVDLIPNFVGIDTWIRSLGAKDIVPSDFNSCMIKMENGREVFWV